MAFVFSLAVLPLRFLGSLAARFAVEPSSWEHRSGPLSVDLPGGAVCVVGFSFRERLDLWSYQVDCLLEQLSSWHWVWVAYRVAFSSLPVVLFRGWR